jgi:uncharacterized protein (DUF2062 family)
MLSKIRLFFLNQLRQGSTPLSLAKAVAVAAVISVFPVIGLTTLLCVIAGHFLKLNQPTLQMVNYALAPVQLLMIPVFLKLGAWICQVPSVSVNPLKIVELFAESPKQFFAEYGYAGLQAILAWALLAPAVGFLAYWICRLIIKKMTKPESL